MKTVKISSLAFVLLTCFAACKNYQLSVQIPAKEQLVLDYPNYDVFTASLQNRSLSKLEVKVVSKKGEERIRSFGLGAMATEKVRVEKENQLILLNNGKQSIKLRVGIEESTRKKTTKKGLYRSFTLKNKGDKSIPLLIPNVMNPNLSPDSESGVNLKVGQQILFKSGFKKYVLLTVDENINNGDVLNVLELLAQRKKELGL